MSSPSSAVLAMVWFNLIHTFSTLFVLYLKKGTLGYSLNCLNGLRNFGKKYTHTYFCYFFDTGIMFDDAGSRLYDLAGGGKKFCQRGGDLSCE